jgi:iron complex outermembrane receptor protein
MKNETLWPTVYGVLAMALCMTAEAAPPIATEIHSFSIPSEDPVAAMLDFYHQSGVLLSADGDAVKGKRFAAVSGQISVDEALHRLVDGTGLTYVYINNTAVSIRPAAGPVAAPPAHSVEGKGAAHPAASETPVVEEIVVTAQRREQNVQEVPVSAIVITNEKQISHHLESLADLTQTVPSVHVGQNGRSNELYIRGIGSGVNSSFDQSVGVFIDDLYHGRSRITDATFLDLERIEILRGPQTTFFGNNAIAGAFNVVTRKPSLGNETDGEARVLYGQFGQYVAEVDGGAPLIADRLAVRAAVISDGEDGWLKNVNSDKHSPTDNNVAGRLSLRYTPNEDWEILAKAEVSRNRNRGALPDQITDCPPSSPFKTAGFCQTALATGAPIGLNNNLTASDPHQGITLNTVEDALTVNYRQWGHTFTSVTGYYNSNYNINLDAGAVDPSNAPLFHAQVPEHYHQFSQELRVASPTGQTLEYLAGAYIQTDELNTSSASGFFFLSPAARANAKLAALVPYLPLGQNLSSLQNEHSYAVFGSLTWNITDSLKLSPGVRGSWVNKDFSESLVYGTATQSYGGIVPLPVALQPLGNAFGLGVPNSASLGRQDHAMQPSAKLQYQLTPAAMTYFSYSRGFKAGGFNGADTSGVPSNLPFSPEHVNAFELGLKSKWFDERMLMNLAVFRMNYRDLQVAALRQFAGAGTFQNIVNNAASSRSQGVELETEWILTHDFRIGAEATYLDAHYLSYQNASPTALEQFQGLKVQDLSGHSTEFAPRSSGSVTAAYSPTLPGGYHLITELREHFSASYFLSGVDDNLLKQGDYSRLDARITLAASSERWNIDVIAQNVTNRQILDFAGPMATSLGSALAENEQPRSFAVQARFNL